MKIFMKSPLGETKQMKLGFSWTMLFFGIFVPLLRMDWKWLGLCFLIDVLSCGIAWLVFPFIYNKIYIKEKIEKGWRPADEMSKTALKAKGIFIPE